MTGVGAPPAASLRRLADATGILPHYVDQTGRERRVTSDETRVAILASMGFDASTEERAGAALADLRAAERGEIVPPVRVVRIDDATLRTIHVRPPGRARGLA